MLTRGLPDAAMKACVAASGPRATKQITLRLGATVAQTKAASTLPVDFGDSTIFHTNDPANVRWPSPDGRQFEFEDVGGFGGAVLLANLAVDLANLEAAPDRLGSFSFAWQNRPLSLAEALERAKRFEAWLRAGGYKPDRQELPAYRAFGITSEDAPPKSWARDWADAERRLDGHETTTGMNLYAVATPDAEVQVVLKNLRREGRDVGIRAQTSGSPYAGRTIFDRSGGYEWQLDIRVSRPEGLLGLDGGKLP